VRDAPRGALSTAGQAVVTAYRERYGVDPAILVRAPGRVNLIGEHTDYNHGFVLPMAIDKAVWIALRPTGSRRVTVYANDLGEVSQFDLDRLRRGTGWAEYLKGVAWALGEAGHELRGWEGVVGGDVPLGAGLSSSAALELATARAFHETSGFAWDQVSMARVGMRAENDWVGANTGIMDQLISAAAVEGRALLIDCLSLTHTPVALPPGSAVVVLDTMTRHSHTHSGYNERRAQCEEAARLLGVESLRDVTLDDLEQGKAKLADVVYRRARHVVSENRRTVAAATAMVRGRVEEVGALMTASHASLRDDFEVSTEALDVMVACAMAQPGCYGARMTGGGFGGSVVALVAADAAAKFGDEVADRYQSQTGTTPTTHVCRASAGASTVLGWSDQVLRSGATL
jgi:galactokinase